MVASILKIVVTRNAICDNLVGFPKSGHKCKFFNETKDQTLLDTII